MRNNYQIKVLTAALLVGSAVFIALIYFNLHPEARMQPDMTPAQQTPNEPAAQKQQQGPAANFTEEDAKRAAAAASTSSAGIQSALDTAAKNAVATNEITLGENCTAHPTAIRIKSGASVTFHNEFAMDQTVSFGDPTRTFTISANSTQTVKPALTTVGVYGFSCGGAKAAGTVIIAE